MLEHYHCLQMHIPINCLFSYWSCKSAFVAEKHKFYIYFSNIFGFLYVRLTAENPMYFRLKITFYFHHLISSKTMWYKIRWRFLSWKCSHLVHVPWCLWPIPKPAAECIVSCASSDLFLLTCAMQNQFSLHNKLQRYLSLRTLCQ